MKVIRSTLLTLVIAGSCVGTAAPMMRGFGARLSGLGRMLNRRSQTALHMAQFSTARRVSFPKKFEPKKLITPPKKQTALLSQKSTSGLFGGWLARAKSFGLRALQALRIVRAESPSIVTKPSVKKVYTVQEMICMVKGDDFNNAQAKEILPFAKQHFVHFIDSGDGCDVLIKIMKVYPDAAEEFIPSMRENFNVLAKDPAGSNLLCYMIKKFPDEVYKLINDQSDVEPSDCLILARAQDRKNRGWQLSQTEAQMLVEIDDLNMSEFMIWLPGEALLPFQERIINKEHALHDDDYVMFYHARASYMHVPTMLDTLLYEICTGSKIKDFLFLHRRYNQQEDIDGKHHEALLEFRSGHYKIIYLNSSLRANQKKYGEQTFPYYFTANSTEGDKYKQKGSVFRDIFALYGFNFYEKFKDELEALQVEYCALSRFGTLYQVAVPYDILDKVVAPASPGGLPCGVTDDMKKIALAIRDPDTYPKASEEEAYTNRTMVFIAPMTSAKGGMMDPGSGIKMYTYMIPTDEKAYQEWQAKWEDLKTRMKAYIQDNYPVPKT